MTSSTRKQHVTSGVNLAAQATCVWRPTLTSASFWYVRFGIQRAFLLGASRERFGGCMAKIIKFYIPPSFRKVSKWLQPGERGKLLVFPMAIPKSA